MLPIMNHREVVGEAKTAEQAARILRQKLSIPRVFVRINGRDYRIPS